jgi:hypothetical protein
MHAHKLQIMLALARVQGNTEAIIANTESNHRNASDLRGRLRSLKRRVRAAALAAAA